MEAERLSFLDRPLPPAFERRRIAVAPGRERAYDEADWRGALVVVERGEIEVEDLDGRCESFRRGDVLWLVGLPLRALHNRGLETTLLVAVSRRRPVEVEPRQEEPDRLDETRSSPSGHSPDPGLRSTIHLCGPRGVRRVLGGVRRLG
jgi:hypothetical protein